MRVIEHPPALVIDEALGSSALGINHCMTVELEVDVRYFLYGLILKNRYIVRQCRRRNQHAVDVQRMLRRHPNFGEFALRREKSNTDIAFILDNFKSHRRYVAPHSGLDQASSGAACN